jgi:hypothetical protein
MLPEVWWQNGYVDIVRPATILDAGSICGTNVLPFVIREPYWEVDYPETIPLVEAALQRLERGDPLAVEVLDRHPH